MKEERKKKELKVAKAAESDRREEENSKTIASLRKKEPTSGENDSKRDLRSKFRKESKFEVDLRKEKSKTPYEPLPLSENGFPLDEEFLAKQLLNCLGDHYGIRL